ncbi:hypothetical protein QR680_012016 [Steinernema hermaphroditum]|uniref:BRCT domain-containing protein n=1 Tax=Steinernema hermaphroditum TaxID=289476 RepID=A0AA39I1W1_9BILA|nr:hypothetical protein QR680_012016 [Steinernema hermaphroditum]
MSTQRRSKRFARETSDDVASKRSRDEQEEETVDVRELLKAIEALKKSHKALEDRVKELETKLSDGTTVSLLSTPPPQNDHISEFVTPKSTKAKSPAPGPSHHRTSSSGTPQKTPKKTSENVLPETPKSSLRPRRNVGEVATPRRLSGRPLRSVTRNTMDYSQHESEESDDDEYKDAEKGDGSASPSDYDVSDSATEPTSDSDDFVKTKRRNSVRASLNGGDRRRSTRNQPVVDALTVPFWCFGAIKSEGWVGRFVLYQLAVFIQNVSKNGPNLHRIVSSLGGTVVDDVQKATHYVADHIDETVEFASALALHIPMVTSSWLTRGEGALSRSAYAKFLLHDLPAEEELELDMETAMELSVFPFAEIAFAAGEKREEVKKIVECCQGRFVDTVAEMSSGFYVTDEPSTLQNKKVRCVDYATFYRAVCRQNLKFLSSKK